LLSSPALDDFLELAHFDKEKIEHIDEKLSGLDQERFLKKPFRDSKGQIWLFDEDLYMIPRNTIVQTAYVSTDQDLINDIVIYNDIMYFSIRNKGLKITDMRGSFLGHYEIKNSKIADNFISQIIDFGEGRLGLCLMNYFQIFNANTNVFEKPIPVPGITRSAFENDTHIWIGGFKDVYRYNKQTRKITTIDIPAFYPNEGNAVNAILDLGEKLYLATASNGFFPISKDSDIFDSQEYFLSIMDDKWTKTKINHADFSPSKEHFALATDNGLWLGRPGDKRDKIKTKYNFYTNVVFQNDSILYATTRDKILRINVNDQAIRSYGSFNGVLNKTFILRSSFRDERNRIYFGGDRGVDVIDENANIENKQFIDLEIDQVFHNGIMQFPTNIIDYKVPAVVKILEIKVNNPKNTLGKSARLQGRISNNNKWSDLSEENIFTLYNPNPGKINLEFRALDENDHRISNIKYLAVKVLQKWYQKIWIWALLGFISLLVISWTFIQYQKKKNDRINKELRLKEELASLKLNPLNSQLNPHFIFNALSSIQQLIAEGETEVAETYLSKFSRLLRHVIHYASHQRVCLKEELSFVNHYLELELLRYDEAFAYAITNELKDGENVWIPPFFIQPQVENAIKHGLLNTDNNNRIDINVSRKANKIVIAIKDNGIGRKPKCLYSNKYQKRKSIDKRKN
jgi:hypothetical protein